MDYLFSMTEEDADKEQELIYRYRAFYCKTKSDIGQIPQDGKLGQNVVLLFLSDPSPIIGYACHSLPN